MASVTSLDQDMRRLRLSRYTPQAANEAKAWIEEVLGERLPGGDLLDNLKDGTVLCRLANLAVPAPGIKFKKSAMPFIQMENISHFLRACEMPPLSLPAHDRFLTVDLYESKDPAQVLQCLGAFSRVANSLNPVKFPRTIGPKRNLASSPTPTGSLAGSRGPSGSVHSLGGGSAGQTMSPTLSTFSRSSERALSPALTGGSASSRGADGGHKSPTAPVSSWSKKSDEGYTAPAWNIHQYGYLGGASQANQGVAFGARRQITTAAPHVPSLADKERKRREQEADSERMRAQTEEAERKRRAEEERARAEEAKQWEEETRRQREEEKRRMEKQKREWEDQERRWQEDEAARLREEAEALKRIEQETERKRSSGDARLRGQFLSEYQAGEADKPRSRRNSALEDPVRAAEQERIRELERQLEEAKERERRYQMEREGRSQESRPASSGRSRPRSPSPRDSELSWAGDEREYLRQQWSDHQQATPRPLPDPTAVKAPPLPSRPLPEPTTPATPTSPRPLPEPTSYNRSRDALPVSRTDRYLASNTPPTAPKPATYVPPEMGLTSEAERAAEDARRVAAQQKTKAGGWASKSLLEREMERERERQREWEESQRLAREAARDPHAGPGAGQSWDVNQYGYLGGDSQNKGAQGIGFGAKRQIIGPRPPQPR